MRFTATARIGFAVAVLAACAPVRSDIPTVPEGADFDVRVGSVARIAGSDLLVRFDTVPEDSRCPSDVQCVWEGNAVAVVTLDSAGRTMAARFSTSKPEPVRAFGWSIELRALRPSRTSQAPPPPSAYVVTLRASP